MVTPSDARDLASKIDDFAKSAQPSITEQGFRLTEFVDAYLSTGRYPADRLEALVYRLMDVKLQLMYVINDLAMMNEQYFRFINLGAPETTPALMLRRMAFEQMIIGRVRITWEKLMRFIYYLETGKDIEASRSLKRKFFTWVAADAPPQWSFMLPYEAVVERHDSQFRTPEYHKNSVVRSHLTGASRPDLNDMISIHNRVNNVIWPNIVSIISGQWPVNFSDLHWSSRDSHTIDARYLPPPEAGLKGV